MEVIGHVASFAVGTAFSQALLARLTDAPIRSTLLMPDSGSLYAMTVPGALVFGLFVTVGKYIREIPLEEKRWYLSAFWGVLYPLGWYLLCKTLLPPGPWSVPHWVGPGRYAQWAYVLCFPAIAAWFVGLRD